MRISGASVLVLSMLVGCGGASGSEDVPDVLDTGRSDRGVDTTEDTSIEDAPDISLDSGAVDSATDTNVDSGPVDSGSDTGVPDSGADILTDSAIDTLSDGADTGLVLPQTPIEHVVVIVQENHSFDNYFGRWCTATPGSNPTCTSGPTCCEAAPDKEPSGSLPVVLDDAEGAAHDPDHSQPCELLEINGGKMDKFVTGASCSSKRNFAIAPAALVKTYHDWAGSYAIADRYFQPLVGASSANEMYFAAANFVFTDNEFKPDSNGKGCIAPTTPTKTYFGEKTSGDLMLNGGYTFSHYAEGYAKMKASILCPAAPSDCPLHLPTTPCNYDPSDNPFQYYNQFKDNPKNMKDYGDLSADLKAGTLPNFVMVKPAGYHNEHPGYSTKISMGIGFAKGIVDQILASKYAANTLILVAWDEGGGYFDHVSPPPASKVDGKPYGTRVPFFAIGKFAKKNHISHVTMEHSSIVKFLEWNFLGSTGQLKHRDTEVANIGSLLDPVETITKVPED